MAKKHEIDIIIEPGGTIKSTISGIQGPSCEQIGQWIQNLGKVTEHKMTNDATKVRHARIQQSAG